MDHLEKNISFTSFRVTIVLNPDYSDEYSFKYSGSSIKLVKLREISQKFGQTEYSAEYSSEF